MPLVPDTFIPPDRYGFSRFSLCRLSPIFAAQDYMAVTQNSDHIRHVFGPDNGWPSPCITWEENFADLERHDQEFADRKAFAYSVLSPDELHYLGCVYIKPIKSRVADDRRKALYDAQVFFWLVAGADHASRAHGMQSELQAWMCKDWPFNAVAFPGRTIAWHDWNAMA